MPSPRNNLSDQWFLEKSEGYRRSLGSCPVCLHDVVILMPRAGWCELQVQTHLDQRRTHVPPLQSFAVPGAAIFACFSARMPDGVTLAMTVWSLFFHPATTSPSSFIIAWNPKAQGRRSRRCGGWCKREQERERGIGRAIPKDRHAVSVFPARWQ